MKLNRKQFADLAVLNDLDDTTFKMSSALWNAVTIWEGLSDPEHWIWKYDFVDEDERMDVVEQFDRAVDEMVQHQHRFTAERKVLTKRWAELERALA